MDPARKVDGRVERGERTRRQILDAAVDIASVEGLEGLSIGRLALKLDMSKSGLFAAFGSKVDLQVATVDRAAEIFVEQVVRRAMGAPRGLPRLRSLCASKLEYMQREVFRGGGRLVALFLEQHADDLAGVGVVFDQQHAGHPDLLAVQPAGTG